jgi:hypothetical protein
MSATEEAAQVEIGPAIAAILRDYADRLSAEARGTTVDVDDLDTMERRVRQLREPNSIRAVADMVAETRTTDIVHALRRGTHPF